MSVLRGIDRAHDVDLGPSGYAPRGHHFSMIGDLAPLSEREKNNAHQAKYRAANKDDINARKRKPRCGEVMPMYGDKCDRPAGHRLKHRSQLWDRHGVQSG